MINERIVLTGTCDFCGRELDEMEVANLPKKNNRFVMHSIVLGRVADSAKSETRKIEGIVCVDCKKILEKWFKIRITGVGAWEN